MIKYSYIKLTGCLVAAALAPLCTSAQRINTEASVERLKSESLQFSYSDNASGIQLDQMDYYSQVGLGYDIEKGSFKRAQEGGTQHRVPLLHRRRRHDEGPQGRFHLG